MVEPNNWAHHHYQQQKKVPPSPHLKSDLVWRENFRSGWAPWWNFSVAATQGRTFKLWWSPINEAIMVEERENISIFAHSDQNISRQAWSAFKCVNLFILLVRLTGSDIRLHTNLLVYLWGVPTENLYQSAHPTPNISRQAWSTFKWGGDYSEWYCQSFWCFIFHVKCLPILIFKT